MKKILLLAVVSITLFLTSCDGMRRMTGGAPETRKDVTGNIARLTRHPDSITITGKGITYFVLHDLANKRLLITANPNALQRFQKHLPEVYIPGRSIEIGYTDIDPLTTFTKDELEELSKRLGVQLNEYKVARIMDWVFKSSDQTSYNENTGQNVGKSKTPWDGLEIKN